MTGVAAEPFRVGLIGLNRHGWHLLERYLAGGPFRVVAAYDSDVSRASAAIGLNVPVVTSVDELAGSNDLDVVWIASQGDVAQFLQHGKHVIVEAPFGPPTNQQRGLPHR